MELSLENLNKASANNGLIIGILSAVFGIVVFYVAPALFGSMWFGIGNTILFLLIYIFFTIDLRKKIGGYWNFKQALRGIFLMAFVAAIVATVINFVFYKFVEPEAFSKISGFIEDGMLKSFENMGMDADTADVEVAKAVDRMKGQFDPTPVQAAQNLGIAILVAFVMSLIFAAIFKREAPIFATIENDVD